MGPGQEPRRRATCSIIVACCSVAESYLTLCEHARLAVLYQLPEFAQTHVHRLSRWCHPTVSSSVTPSLCPQSFPALGFLPCMLHIYLFQVKYVPSSGFDSCSFELLGQSGLNAVGSTAVGFPGRPSSLPILGSVPYPPCTLVHSWGLKVHTGVCPPSRAKAWEGILRLSGERRWGFQVSRTQSGREDVGSSRLGPAKYLPWQGGGTKGRPQQAL